MQQNGILEVRQTSADLLRVRNKVLGFKEIERLVIDTCRYAIRTSVGSKFESPGALNLTHSHIFINIKQLFYKV